MSWKLTPHWTSASGMLCYNKQKKMSLQLYSQHAKLFTRNREFFPELLWLRIWTGRAEAYRKWRSSWYEMNLPGYLLCHIGHFTQNTNTSGHSNIHAANTKMKYEKYSSFDIDERNKQLKAALWEEKQVWKYHKPSVCMLKQHLWKNK